MNRLRLTRQGQFIPMAAMVMLSVVVFMVGIVNVFTISRAKLRAQNLADAAAMYVAGHMVQSLNNAADKNEWLDLIYGDPNDPSYSTAGHDPCVPPGDKKKVPPGVGCFASGRPTPFVFGDVRAAIAYANLVNTVNQTQLQFMNVFNSLLGAHSGVATNSNSNALQANLYNAIPDLQKPEVYAIVFNSANGQNSALSNMKMEDQNSGSGPPKFGVDSPLMQPITYTIHDVSVKYKSVAFLPGTTTKTLTDLMGGTPTGYLEIAKPSLHAWDGASKGGEQIAAGAIVRVTVSLLGLGTKAVQARSMAYVVLTSGGVGFDSQGTARPTYFLKLGKPV